MGFGYTVKLSQLDILNEAARILCEYANSFTEEHEISCHSRDHDDCIKRRCPFLDGASLAAAQVI